MGLGSTIRRILGGRDRQITASLLRFTSPSGAVAGLGTPPVALPP